ncbi:hypothetical protein AG1IA_05235 [Rhizoctonia solani AG-1 IA]|uniref:Uncharacterized protein n=1 Tax=Thanatephorus cucumeris (strain AG1-IA) TaxID=983506 RepID=L8WRH4_THACA|nr:hypothetical protein AG1IA_05235 [Rhizoctonia solani AG-1 IA]
MFVFIKLAAIVSLASCILAAPVEAPAGTGTNKLAIRAPYDVHNGWVSKPVRQPTVSIHPSDDLRRRASVSTDTKLARISDNPSVGTGACGWNNGDYEWVAAVGTSLFQEMMVGESSAILSTANPSIVSDRDHSLAHTHAHTQTATRTTARLAARPPTSAGTARPSRSGSSTGATPAATTISTCRRLRSSSSLVSVSG